MERSVLKFMKKTISILVVMIMSLSNLIVVLAEQTTIWVARPTAEERIVDTGGAVYGYGSGSGGQGESVKRFYSVHDNESITSPIYYYTLPRIGMDGNPVGGSVPGYCIQPGKKNGSLSGMINDFENSLAWKRFTDEQRLTASVILLYGYRFDMSGNPIFLNQQLEDTGYTRESAYVATQILLWEVVEGMRTNLDGYNSNYVAPAGAPSSQTNQYWSSVIQGKPAYDAYVGIITSMSKHFLKPIYAYRTYEEADRSLEKEKLKYSGGNYFIDLKDQNTVETTGLQIGDFSSIRVSFEVNGIENVTIYDSFATKTDGWYTYHLGNYIYQGNSQAKVIVNDGNNGGVGYEKQNLGLKIDFGKEMPTAIKIELTKNIDKVESLNQTGIVFWSDATNIKVQDRVAEAPIDPIIFHIAIKREVEPIPPTGTTERIIYEPEFNYPEFNFEGQKKDTEKGFDNNDTTPRGDASLDAIFSGKWEIDTGKQDSFEMQADHNGKGASETIEPWQNKNDLNNNLTHDALGQIVAIELKGTFHAEITELPPEGYLSEQHSESGNGIRQYEVTYNAKTYRNATDIVYPILNADGDYEWSEIESSYTGFLEYCELNGIEPSLLPDADSVGNEGFTYAGSSNAWNDVNYQLDGGYDGLKHYVGKRMQHDLPDEEINEEAWKVDDFTYQVAKPESENGADALTFYNRVIKGMYHLTKNIADNSLCPFEGADGNNQNGSKPLSGIPWSLELESDTGEEKYLSLVAIKVGEPGYVSGGGTYRVITGGNKSNTSSGTINSQSGSVPFPDESNSFVANGDSTELVTGRGGDLYIYDIPAGTYKLSELHCDKNIGYVMEITHFTIEKLDEDGNNMDYLVNYVDNDGFESGINVVHESITNYIIRNEIEVVKKDRETGKTVPSSQTAFRIRYLGLPNTEGGVYDPDAICSGCGKPMSTHQSGYLINPQNSKGNGYEYVFYTDANGKIKLPFKLEFGSYQLEEITAPEGYYIGKYDADGKASSGAGELDFSSSVPLAIYDQSGKLVTWSTQIEYENGMISDSELAYNYYQFNVAKQDDREEGTPLPPFKIVVEMLNNSVKGNIEVSKLADVLVGFKKVETSHGTTYQPVYEKKSKEGIQFDIIAAEDITLPDGVDAPDLYDALGNLITLDLQKLNHNQFPDAVRSYYKKLSHGEETYYIEEADMSKDKKMTYATLLTSTEKGTSYLLEFDEEVESLMYGKYTNHYKYTFGLEYATGGFNFSDVEMEKITTFSDYIGYFPESQMPKVYQGNEDSYNEIPLEDTMFSDGNHISIQGKINEIRDLETQMIVDLNGDEIKQINEDYIIVSPAFDSDGASNRPTVLPGYEMDEINVDTMYLIFSTDNKIDTDYDGIPDKPDYMVYVQDKEGNFRFIHCNEVGDAYLSRVQKLSLDLIQHTKSENGFRITGFTEYGQSEIEVLQFVNLADKVQEESKVEVMNPYQNGMNARDERVTIRNAELDIKTAEGTIVTGNDAHRTILVKQKSQQSYYQLKDGIQVNINYSGGFTKTSIKVPLEADFPEIIIHGESVDYMYLNEPSKILSPTNATVEYGIDENGSYIRSKLISQTQKKENGQWVTIPGYRIIEIVSNATTEIEAIKVKYPDERQSYSIVTIDAESEAFRGQLVMSAESKTIKSVLGKVVETITTGSNGTALSSPLPLGKYYVRERDSKNHANNQVGSMAGLVGSKDVYPVALVYGGQYVPLVWASTAVENQALGVQLDLTKGFQESYGGNKYIPKAGAIFGVFTYDNDIVAKGTAETIAVDQTNLTADSMVATLISDDKGKAVSSLILPFGNYYVKEIATLPGYIVSDKKFVFRVDETTNSDSLGIHMFKDGIDGEVNFIGFNTTEVIIHTKHQIPSLPVTINGMVFDTQTAFETTVDNIVIKNAVDADRSTMSLTVVKEYPATIQFGNGARMLVTSYEDAYDVEFVNAEDGIWNIEGMPTIDNPYIIDIGTATNIKFDSETNRAVYTQQIAYTGYTTEVTVPYIAPDEVVLFTDGTKAQLIYDMAGKRKVVISLPKNVVLPVFYTFDSHGEKVMPAYYSKYYTPDQNPEMKELPVWLTYDMSNKTVNQFVVDIDNMTDFQMETLTFGGLIKDIITVSKDQNGSTIDSFELISQNNVETRRLPKIVNKANKEILGFQKSGIAVLKDDEKVSLIQENKVLELFSENKGAGLQAFVLPGGQSINVKKVTGGLVRALLGTDDITNDLAVSEVILSKGQSLVAYMADGSVYNIEMDKLGSVNMQVTGIANGALSIGENAPHVKLNGSMDNIKDINAEIILQVFPLDQETREEMLLQNIQSVTYARNNNFVKELQVKINYNGLSSIPTEVIKNDKLPEVPGVPEKPEKPGKPDEPKEPTIFISKKDVTTGKELAGAEIVVYDKDNKEIFKGTTDTMGKVHFKKPSEGTYTFKETVAPEKYYLNTTIFTFTVNKDGSITGDDTITDVPIREIMIDKTDLTDGKELPGAEIIIYDKDQNIVFTGVTDEKGKIYFTPPAIGEYTFREIVAPEGYILNTTLFNFTIHEDGAITGTFNITNEPIKKIDLNISTTPKTGDKEILIFSMLFILFISTGVIYVSSRKRKEKY